MKDIRYLGFDIYSSRSGLFSFQIVCLRFGFPPEFRPFKCIKLNIISEFNDDFSEDFFEVLHILVGQKIKILENRPDFLTFSAKTHIRL